LATVLPAAFGGKPRSEFAGKKVGIILTGGNIDPRLLANVILGNLARIGKLGRIAIRITDEVGQLGKIIDIFTECRANIIEIAHQRIFGGALAKDLATEIEYEVRDAVGGELLVERLLDAGYSFDRVLVSGERRRAYRKGEKPNGNAR
jgi:threonine dehydratase